MPGPSTLILVLGLCDLPRACHARSSSATLSVGSLCHCVLFLDLLRLWGPFRSR